MKIENISQILSYRMIWDLKSEYDLNSYLEELTK